LRIDIFFFFSILLFFLFFIPFPILREKKSRRKTIRYCDESLVRSLCGLRAVFFSVDGEKKIQSFQV